MGAKKAASTQDESSGSLTQTLSFGLIVILASYAVYVNVAPRMNAASSGIKPATETETSVAQGGGAGFFFPLKTVETATKVSQVAALPSAPFISYEKELDSTSPARAVTITNDQPVLGAIPSAGFRPLYGIKHDGGDAIFALACNYPKEYYQRFAGSLRKFGYKGDIVLAVSPPEKMKNGVGEYLKEINVVAYGFEVDCEGTDNCKLKDEVLGYPDPRPFRTFANIRYALYEYCMRQYTAQSYILILDFRDTFFQGECVAASISLASYLGDRSETVQLKIYYLHNLKRYIFTLN